MFIIPFNSPHAFNSMALCMKYTKDVRKPPCVYMIKCGKGEWAELGFLVRQT